ncbi:beta-glucanosyltransferase gel2, partial [Aureobasidium melanogenum]
MSVLSGGLVYEYSEDTNDYGLVNITSADEIHLLQDYGFLATQYSKLDENLLTSANSTATGQTPPTCDPSLITGSGFYNSWDLPARPSGVDALISSGISSANKGKTVSVTSTAMPATVYDYNGQQLNGLELTVLEEQDSNHPGLAGNYTPSTPTGTAAATSGSSSSTGGSSSATRSSSGKASSTASQTAATSKGAAAPVLASSGAATFGALLASLFFLHDQHPTKLNYDDHDGHCSLSHTSQTIKTILCDENDIDTSIHTSIVSIPVAASVLIEPIPFILGQSLPLHSIIHHLRLHTYFGVFDETINQRANKMQHYNHHNRKQCLVCPRHEKTEPCVNCQCSHYCSKECQVVDLPVHRALCKSFAQFRDRPNQAVRRAIYLPASRPNPEFVWLKMDQKYGYNQPDLASMRANYLENSENCLWPVEVNVDLVRMAKIYPHIIFGYQSKPPSKDEPINQSITKLTGNDDHGVRGSVIAYGQIKQEGEDGVKQPIVTDLDTTDLRIITNYFLGTFRYEGLKFGAVLVFSDPESKPDCRSHSTLVSSNLAICNGDMGLWSQISILYGMPLVIIFATPLLPHQHDNAEVLEEIERIRAEQGPNSANRLASLLLVDMGNFENHIAENFGTIHPDRNRFRAQGLGNAIVIRKDQKPLSPAYLEAFCTWIEEDLLPKFTDANEQIRYALATDLDEQDPRAWKRGADLLRLRQKMWDRCSRTRFNAWCKEKGIKLGQLGQL